VKRAPCASSLDLVPHVAAVLILLLTSAGSISAADKQQRKARKLKPSG
jgi:hypothetical protein